MKLIVILLAVFLAWAKAFVNNSTPIMAELPGWQIGTKQGNNIEVRLFYDLLCPDSYEHHKNLL